ncbi:MAG TPA: DedA family protein [Candidatus Binataceae bacterium]|nr:DedA family protein [Candidatus Binataceae bacterium]
MHEIIKPEHIAEVLATWGYLGIFICVFVGNLGVPVPEETVMLAAGFLAGRSILDLRMVYLVTIASAVSGDTCGFILGRTGGQRLLARLAANFSFARQRYDRLQIFFQTHGAKAVFMARFIAGVRFMAGPMAGAAGMPFLRFLGWNVLGAVIWCTLISTVGYLVGDELYHALRVAHLASLWVAVAVILFAAAFVFMWWRDRREPIVPPEP